MQPAPDSGLTEDFIIPIAHLTAADSPSVVYVSFTRDVPSEYTLASFQCTLKFVSKELDPSSGEPEEEGYEDEYQLEEVELGAGGDYIIPSYSNFSAEWDRLRSGSTATETFALSAMDSIKGKQMSLLRAVNCYLEERSCCGFHCGNLEHGATWRYRASHIDLCSHIAIVRFGYWRWRKGACAKPDDLFFRTRSDSRTGGAGGETRSDQACDNSDWRLSRIFSDSCTLEWESYSVICHSYLPCGFPAYLTPSALDHTISQSQVVPLRWAVRLCDMATRRPSSGLMSAPSLPTPKVIKVDTRGAVILHEESPEVSMNSIRPEPWLMSNRREIVEVYIFQITSNLSLILQST